jgi:hypothetical protein
MGDSAADDPLRFGRSPFWASGLTDFNRALRIACVRCCNRQVLWPRRYFPKLANRLCRHADVLVYLNAHRGWKATESNLEGSDASWFVPHRASLVSLSCKTEARSISSQGTQSQPAPRAPCSLRGAYRDRCCRGMRPLLPGRSNRPQRDRAGPSGYAKPSLRSGLPGLRFCLGLWDPKGCAGPVGRTGFSGARNAAFCAEATQRPTVSYLNNFARTAQSLASSNFRSAMVRSGLRGSVSTSRRARSPNGLPCSRRCSGRCS